MGSKTFNQVVVGSIPTGLTTPYLSPRASFRQHRRTQSGSGQLNAAYGRDSADGDAGSGLNFNPGRKKDRLPS